MHSNVPLTILIRHLPTLDDEKNILTPYDSDNEFLPINEAEIKNIAYCLEQISQITGRKICFYTSPVMRATEMANLINRYMKTKETITIDSRWCNINQGEVSGIRQSEFKNEPLWRNWHERPEYVSFPNGETLHDVQKRVNEALSMISRNTNINVIISHTTPLQVAITSLLGIDLSHIWRFYFEYYAITIVVNNVILCANAKLPDLQGLRKLDFKNA